MSAIAASSKRQDTQTYLRVGALTLVSALLLVGIVFWLKRESFHQGAEYEVVFDDVDGLREGGAVQMMGIRVGVVESLTPIVHPKTGQHQVLLKFALKDASVKPPKASVLSVQQSGLIGDKYLEVVPPQWRSLVVDVPTGVSPVQSPTLKAVLPNGGRQVAAGEARLKSCVPRVGRGPTCFYDFRITVPGLLAPSRVQPVLSGKGGEVLTLKPLKPETPFLISEARSRWFTVREPVRMSDFMDLQLEVAQSLREVNTRIIRLMSDTTIADLQTTANELKQLGRESRVLAHELRVATQFLSKDLHELSREGVTLLASVQRVTTSVDQLVNDPALRQELPYVVRDLRQVSTRLNALLSSPELTTLMQDLSVAAGNLKQLTTIVNGIANDPQARARLMNLLTDAEQTIQQAEALLTKVNTAVGDDPNAIKKTIEDAQASASNLRKLTDRLKGRFLLFKLLF